MLDRPLKIIWNITKKCGYNCNICATYSDRDELDFIRKKQVLDSILSIGLPNVKEIDFSGGDPLYDSESIKIIYSAIDLLGRKKVSVTTTGKGINYAIINHENLLQLLYNCEITIDDVINFPNTLRNDVSYVSTNQDAINSISDNIENLIVNVPILYPNMDDIQIGQLVDEIATIKVHNICVNLIRLMNTGRMVRCQYPCSYSPEHFVKTFIKFSRNTRIKDIHLHCALRGKMNNCPCNMLEDKIGVDCSGNVFACAWGAYISDFSKDRIADNPFYIGNLLEKNCQKCYLLTSRSY